MVSVRSVLKWAVLAIGALVVLSSLAGVILGQPVGLTYVETGSMEPALSPNDGFIAIPSALTGPPEAGDVVVFDAEELHGGGLVTHRVVGEQESGYITKGDANPVTDQDGAEPPVQDEQIKAKALQIGSFVVKIPLLGLAPQAIAGAQRALAATLGTRALLGTQGLAYLMIGFGVVTYLLAGLFEQGGTRSRSRRSRRSTGAVTPQKVVIVMTACMIVLLTLSMTVAGGQHEFQFVSSEVESESPGVIQQGTSKTTVYQVPSNGPLPIVAIIEPGSDSVNVSATTLYVPGSSERDLNVTIQAPPETGTYTESITEYRYLAFLPTGVLVSLHEIHPWAPIVAIDALLGILLIAISLLLLGVDPIRLSRREGSIPLRVWLRRWLD